MRTQVNQCPIEYFDSCSKIRLTENVFLRALTLKHNNVFILTKRRHFSRKCTDSKYFALFLLKIPSRLRVIHTSPYNWLAPQLCRLQTILLKKNTVKRRFELHYFSSQV